MTLEDILREKGMTLRKGVLGDEGDVEFWDEEDVKKNPVVVARSEQDEAAGVARRKENLGDGVAG